MLAEQERAQRRAQRAGMYEARAIESRRHAQTLRELHADRRILLDDMNE
jgi:hypothetical protein